MTLETIPLQLQGIFDELGRLFGGVTQVEGLPVVTPILPYIFIIVFAVVGFFSWRVWSNTKAYPNPESRVGKMSFLWMGQYQFTGNVSRYVLPLSQEIFEQLYMEEDYKLGVKELENLVETKKLFLFEINLTEWDDALNLKTKESGLIISPVDIASDKYSWEDTKTKWSSSLLAYEQRKYVSLYESTRKFEVRTLDNTLREVWVISPIPRYIEEVGEDLDIDKDIPEWKISKKTINITNLPSMSHLAELVPKLVGVAKATAMIKQRNISIDSLNDIIRSKDAKIAEVENELSIANAIASTQPLFGDAHKKPPEEESPPWMWFALFAIGTLIGTKLPESVVQLSELDPVVTGFLCAIIVGGIYYFTRGKSEEEQKQRYLEE